MERSRSSRSDLDSSRDGGKPDADRTPGSCSDEYGRYDERDKRWGAVVDQHVTRDRFDAVLFDLDGVLTATARLHAASWKRMFDDYLAQRAAQVGEPFQPFEIATDYKRYVDGKLRYDGVRSFLGSRGIDLPDGDPDDPPDRETVSGLGNRKNELIGELLDTDGVDVYEESIAWLRQLRRRGFATAVVSARRTANEYWGQPVSKTYSRLASMG